MSVSHRSSGSLSRMSGPGFGGMGQFGGAFLLINALSSKIYELIAESTQTIVRGYEQGGVVGLIRSTELRALVRRYLWLLCVAFAFERLRWLWSIANSFVSLKQYLYIDATLRTGDQAYEWMLAFWEHSKAFKSRSRDFVIETGSKNARKRAMMAMSHSESIYMDNPIQGPDTDLQTRLSPKDNAEQWIWHKGTLFYLRKWLQTIPGNWGAEAMQTPVIRVRSYSFTRKPIFKLLKEAKEVYDRTRPQMITIRVLDNRGTWRKVAYKARRPLSSIIMDAEKRAALLQDAQEFLKSEDWYGARGLRWNRGYLLHGAPGTGKSSTIQALASEIKLDVYIISINSPMMNDSVLGAAMRSIPPKSIVCIEDVDAIFSTQKRDLENANRQAKMNPHFPQQAVYPGMRMMNQGGGANISLSAALNAIDGVESNEGRLLMMSTNVALDELDAALTRPGRCDMFVFYKRATRAQAEELYNIFYTPTAGAAPSNTLEDLVESGDEAPSGSKTPPQNTRDVVKTVARGQSAKSSGHHPFDLPDDVTPAKITEWAKLWAIHVEDEQFTIAELQGMLLKYKKDPESAMMDMPGWVKAEEIARVEAEKQKEKKKEAEEKQKAEAEAAAAKSVNAHLTGVNGLPKPTTSGNITGVQTSEGEHKRVKQKSIKVSKKALSKAIAEDKEAEEGKNPAGIAKKDEIENSTAKEGGSKLKAQAQQISPTNQIVGRHTIPYEHYVSEMETDYSE